MAKQKSLNEGKKEAKADVIQSDLTELFNIPKSFMIPEPKGHKNEPETKKTWVKWYPTKGRTFDEIVESAKELGRDYFVCAMSGGKDSVSLADKLDKKGELKGVFHIDTMTGVKATQDFVKDLCQSRGWKLYIRNPTPFKYVYVALVLEIGFPGPVLHPVFMNYLKYRTMKKFVREPYFVGRGLCLASGVRETESLNRMGNYEEPISQDGKMWTVCSWFYEPTTNIYRYFIENNLKKTPAHDIMGFSAECNDGAFAGDGEAKRLELVDKELAAFIRWIEEGVRQFGTPTAKKHSKWGGQGMTEAEAQQVLEQFPEWKNFKQVEKLICGSECGPSTMRGAGYA